MSLAFLSAFFIVILLLFYFVKQHKAVSSYVAKQKSIFVVFNFSLFYFSFSLSWLVLF